MVVSTHNLCLKPQLQNTKNLPTSLMFSDVLCWAACKTLTAEKKKLQVAGTEGAGNYSSFDLDWGVGAGNYSSLEP